MTKAKRNALTKEMRDLLSEADRIPQSEWSDRDDHRLVYARNFLKELHIHHRIKEKST